VVLTRRPQTVFLLLQEDFQVRFWKRRQAAYGDYVQLHSGLQIRQVCLHFFA